MSASARASGVVCSRSRSRSSSSMWASWEMPFTSASSEMPCGSAPSPVRPPDSWTSASSRCRRARKAALSPSAVWSAIGVTCAMRYGLLASSRVMRCFVSAPSVMLYSPFGSSFDFVDHAGAANPRKAT